MSENVLIITPSKKFGKAIEGHFVSEGCKVTIFSDADALVEVMGTMSIDLVITDIKMKEVSGFKLLKELRTHEKFKKIPALILVDESEGSFKCRARAAGATGWLSKPPEGKQIRQIVDKLLD